MSAWNGSRSERHQPVITRVINKPSPLIIENSNFNHYKLPPSYDDSALSEQSPDHGPDNPIPLPPRDRTRSVAHHPTKPRHQRKHPLIVSSHSSPESPLSPSAVAPESQPTQQTQQLQPTQQTQPIQQSQLSQQSLLSLTAPAKPPRACNLDDSYDSQIASELEALDDMEEEASNHSVTSSSSLYQSKDHVSCEDLLDFACDRPNSKRTRGPAQGTDSDEVLFTLINLIDFFFHLTKPNFFFFF